ncbi:hypothetical protein EYF80_037027 [Liparis tanakae]|uniref:Uncharacterized protein n=1 Tax=Liparis tanakae TaxID=230148 RepID=A0A4Z2GJ27_9TELE|nr:hypothetical protein EYF80_037027 [Liparis tanakae]
MSLSPACLPRRSVYTWGEGGGERECVRLLLELLKAFWARKTRFSSDRPRLLCTSALYFMLMASHSWGHSTLSGTRKGTRPCGGSGGFTPAAGCMECANRRSGRSRRREALEDVTTASLPPFTFTWKTSSLPPTLNCDSNRMVNFSSVTDSAPRRSDRLILFRDYGGERGRA